ncbi:MAG: NAD(P)-dependent oxidoreductase [Schwartzia sp.]|nr:NAD(P)-dependent oxidoreductase [Schwartzia sp. (in: firmicutes)]
MTAQKKSIGFIGLGVMGASMAHHLLDAGYPLTVYNRTKAKADSLVNRGAKWVDTPAEVAAASDIVITIVGFPKDVEQVYLGENGILQTKKGGHVIDMTTSSPLLAKKIYDAAKKKGIAALDAPVSGGDIGARNASLVIMVGGDRKAFDEVQKMFECIGRTIRYFGAAGSGQYTKMANQIAIASGMMGVAEALIYAEKAGLNPAEVLETIAGGAAGSWSLSNLGPRMIKGDVAPGFYIKHFIKDMRIALESAKEMHLDLPGLTLAKRLYDELAARGMEDCGTQAIIRWYMSDEQKKSH